MPPKASSAAETRVYKGTTNVNGKSYWRHPSRPWVVVRGKVPGLYALLNGPYGAENQIKGYPYGKYVRQSSHTEAVAFLDANGMDINTHDWARLPGDERLLAEWNRQMALYEEKVNGDPNFLEQLRAEGRALGLTDEADQPPDESTMLLRLSARMHVLEKENEELKAANVAQQTMYRKALVEADKMAQKQVMRQFREFQAKEEALKKRIAELEATLAAVPALGEAPPLQITDGGTESGGAGLASAPRGNNGGVSQAANFTEEGRSVRDEGPARGEGGSRGAELDRSIANRAAEAVRFDRSGAHVSGTQEAQFDRGADTQAPRGGPPEEQDGGVDGTGVLSDDEEMLAEILNGGLSGAEAEEAAAYREVGAKRDGQHNVGPPRPSTERGQRENEVEMHSEEFTATGNGGSDPVRSEDQLANPPLADLNLPPGRVLPVIPFGAVENAPAVTPNRPAAATSSVARSTEAARASSVPSVCEASASVPLSGIRAPLETTARETRVERTVPQLPVVSVPRLPNVAVAPRPDGPLPIETITGPRTLQSRVEVERPDQASKGLAAPSRPQAGSGRESVPHNVVTPAGPARVSPNPAANPVDPHLNNQAPVTDNPAGLGGVTADRAAALEGLLQSGVFKSAARHRRKLLMTYKGGKQPAKKPTAPAPRKTDYVRQGEEGYVEGEQSVELGRSSGEARESNGSFRTASGVEQLDGSPGVPPKERGALVAHRSVGVGGPEATSGIAFRSVGNQGARSLLPTEAVGMPGAGVAAPSSAVGATVRRAYFPSELIPAVLTDAGTQATGLGSASATEAASTPVGAIAPAVEPPFVDPRIAPGLGIPVGLQGLGLGLGQSRQPNRPSEQTNMGLEENAVAGQAPEPAKKRAPRKRKSAAETGDPAPRKRKKKVAGEGTSGELGTGVSTEASGEVATRATGTTGGDNVAGTSGGGVPGGAAGGEGTEIRVGARTGVGAEKAKRKRVRKPDSRYFNPDGTRKPAEERPPPKPRRAPNPETERIKNRCRFDGCSKYATFGYPTGPGSIRRARCVAHKLPGMLTDKRCHVEGCEKRAHCRFPGKRVTHCTRHAEPGMINAANNARFCKAEGCEKVATLGWEDQKTAIACHTHKQPGMVRTGAHQLCLAPGCKKRFSHAFLGDKRPSFCKRHAQPGMINIRSLPKCNQPLCKEAVTHGFQGDKRPSRCQQHTLPGMVDFTAGQHVLGRRAEPGLRILA
ncbi:hypothetical protein KFL_004650110 [Klebsormidium nitens]|uniref:Uncharacterized protein n=1 Tax=Klebsormidium nitens TaxID=105231 RepID=A0A1Y1IJF9_KLENI|nr:hypothetical protein KFL_004650110 [Klebsormidium nitens]|eukprot:GAQ88866.1 hypothetical protein KFL_004650110 [Klebsormidium nitens]